MLEMVRSSEAIGSGKFAVRRAPCTVRVACAPAAYAFLRWTSMILHCMLGQVGFLGRPPTGGAFTSDAMLDSTEGKAPRPRSPAPSNEARGSACFSTLSADAGFCHEALTFSRKSGKKRKWLWGSSGRRSEDRPMLLRRRRPLDPKEPGGSLHERPH